MFVGASSGFPVGSDGVTGEPPSETSWAAVLPLFFLFFLCVCESRGYIYNIQVFFHDDTYLCVAPAPSTHSTKTPFFSSGRKTGARVFYLLRNFLNFFSFFLIHSFIIINPVSPGVFGKRPELTIVFFHLQDGRRSEEKGTTRKFCFILFAAVRWWSFCCTALQTKESHRHKLSLADYGSSRSLERKSNSTWWRRRRRKKTFPPNNVIAIKFYVRRLTGCFLFRI